MKRLLLIVVAASLLLTGCGLLGGNSSSTPSPDSSSTPISSSSTPTSSSSEQDSSAPDSSSAPTTSSSAPDSSSAEQVQDVSAWIGSYAKQPGSAGQITLEVTQGSTTGTVHFVLNAKGLVFEGDALVYKDGSALCEAQGNLTLKLERQSILVTEGKPLIGSADFSGSYDKLS